MAISKAQMKHVERVGGFAFVLGIALAVLAGIPMTGLGASETAALLLVVFGLIVGFLNIKDKDKVPFLVAAIALIAVSTSGIRSLPYIGETVGSILTYIEYFVTPAAIVVAVKAVYDLGRQ